MITISRHENYALCYYLIKILNLIIILHVTIHVIKTEKKHLTGHLKINSFWDLLVAQTSKLNILLNIRFSNFDLNICH